MLLKAKFVVPAQLQVLHEARCEKYKIWVEKQKLNRGAITMGYIEFEKEFSELEESW